MDTTVIIISIIGILIIGFFAMKKIDAFLEESSENIHYEKRPNLIHLGFDTPCLAEDFICKMNDADKNEHSMEVMVYCGTNDEMIDMLLAGKLDYVILTNLVKSWDRQKGLYKEVVLQPKGLRTSAADIYIESSSKKSMKAAIFWIPGWIDKEKEYFSDLLTKLV